VQVAAAPYHSDRPDRESRSGLAALDQLERLLLPVTQSHLLCASTRLPSPKHGLPPQRISTASQRSTRQLNPHFYPAQTPACPLRTVERGLEMRKGLIRTL
jgi:hypothetical protein